MLKELVEFMEQKPGFIKRALVTPKRIIAWSVVAPDIVIKHWKQHTAQPLRLIPLSPKEGDTTQELWNNIWDKAKNITKGVRLVAN